MDFRPLEQTELQLLRTALRGNADDGLALLMDRQSSFAGVSLSVGDPTDDEVISAIKSVPCHYVDVEAPPELGYENTPIGLKFYRHLAFEQWEALGVYLGKIDRSIQWLIGDWLIYGETQAWGEMYAQALDHTRLDEKTLRNYKWVAGAFHMTRRREKLSWTHHATVAGLEQSQQDKWLDLAERENLSVADLKYRLEGGTVSATVGNNQIGGSTGDQERSEPDPLARIKSLWKKLTQKGREEFRRWIVQNS